MNISRRPPAESSPAPSNNMTEKKNIGSPHLTRPRLSPSPLSPHPPTSLPSPLSSRHRRYHTPSPSPQRMTASFVARPPSLDLPNSFTLALTLAAPAHSHPPTPSPLPCGRWQGRAMTANLVACLPNSFLTLALAHPLQALALPSCLTLTSHAVAFALRTTARVCDDSEPCCSPSPPRRLPSLHAHALVAHHRRCTPSSHAVTVACPLQVPTLHTITLALAHPLPCHCHLTSYAIVVTVAHTQTRIVFGHPLNVLFYLHVLLPNE